MVVDCPQDRTGPRWPRRHRVPDHNDMCRPGATGALGFTLAATVDLMSPWLSTGQLTHGSFLANTTQVVLRGVTLPLVTALATGFIDLAFWTKSGARATSACGVWLTSPGLALTLALLVQVGLGFTDIAVLSDAVLVGIHVAALGTNEFPDTQPSYELPGSVIGYQPGFGAAYSVQPASADGSTRTDQVVVVAAVKNGFSLIVLEDGALLSTVTSSSPLFNGHPSPAGVNMAYGVGDFIVNRIGFP